MGLNSPSLQDSQLTVTKALPSGASSVSSTALDLGNGPRGDFSGDAELLLSAPALAVGQLANGSTMTYKLEDSADNSSFATIQDSFLVQTGAGGAGAAAATKRFRPPLTCRRYVRVTATNSAAADASAASLTLQLLV